MELAINILTLYHEQSIAHELKWEFHTKIPLTLVKQTVMNWEIRGTFGYTYSETVWGGYWLSSHYHKTALAPETKYAHQR